MDKSVSSSRIVFLDVLRGFTMLLVVYWHVDTILLNDMSDIQPSTLNLICQTFRMPLFFFIMGFFMYSNKYDAVLLKKRAKNRLLKQLYPTILFFCIYVVLIKQSIISALYLESKEGYWFTLVSVEFFFIIAPLLYVFCSKGIRREMQCAIIIFVILLAKILSKISLLFPAIVGSSYYSLFSLNHFMTFLPYVLLGCILKMYWKYFEKKMIKKSFIIIAIAFFILVSMINGGPYTIHLQALLGIYILFSVVYLLPESFHCGKVGRSLKFIGGLTLEIYLLHYIVILGIQQIPIIMNICYWMKKAPLEVPLLFVVAILITVLCIATIELFRMLKMNNVVFPKEIHKFELKFNRRLRKI